jgi:hypothetical protein
VILLSTWAIIAVVPLALAGSAFGEVYFMQGYHGGYYLTRETEYQEALDKLFDVIERHSEFKVVFELEPYTIQRMRGGERFACETFQRDKPILAAWMLAGQGDYDACAAAGAARSGSYGVRVAFRGGAFAHAIANLPAEKLRGRTLVFSGWTRQHKGTGAHLSIDAWDEARYIPGSSMRSPKVPDDGGWHRLEMTWQVPQNACRILPQAKCDGGPTEADFDDLMLQNAHTGQSLLRNGGFEKVAAPTLRDEARLEKLRQLVHRGQIEIVGGAYTQPILYAIGEESALRQFTYGMRAVEEAMGPAVKIYAAQEPGLCSQLPQMLSQAGLEGVLYRTIWGIFGAPPHRNAEVISWVGPDGSQTRAVPSYEVFPLPRYGLITHPAAKWIDKLKRVGIERPIFTLLDDFLTETVPEPDSPLLRHEFGFGWANLCRRIAAESLRGKEMVFSGTIRTRQEKADLYLDSHDAGGMVISSAKSESVAADGQWHTVRVRYRVPEHAVWLFPQGRLVGATGDADFDALRLAAADGQTVLSASFEPGDLEGFSVGTSEQVHASHRIASGGAAEGNKFVSIQMQAQPVMARGVTLGEYFRLVGPPQQEWRDAFHGFEFRFPFGLLAGQVQRADRESENLLLQTERLLALAGVDPGTALDDAWESHLMGEHHDGWVCAPSVFGIWKQPTYAAMCAAAFDEAQRNCRRLLKDVGCLTQHGQASVRTSGNGFAIVNTSGFARREMLPVRIALSKGVAKQPAILAADVSRASEDPGQVQVLARHDDGSAKELDVVLLAQVPALASRRYRVAEGTNAPLPEVKVLQDDPPQMDNGLVRVLAAKKDVHIAGQAGPPLPILLAGDFPGQGEVQVAVGASAVTSQGGAGIAFGEGTIGHVPFRATFRMEPDMPLVRMRLEFDFGERTDVGAREDLHSQGLPAHARDDHKLRLVLPLPFADPRCFSQAAFEVRQVQPGRYPVLRYAMAESATGGAAVFTDRATMAVFRDRPPALEIVLAYGGKFIYAPQGAAPLVGKQQFELGLLPYQGTWQQARIPQWSEVFSQPLLVARSGAGLMTRPSLVAIEPEDAAVVTAVLLRGKHLLVRLWRPYEGQADLRVRIRGASDCARTDLLHRSHPPQGEVLRMRQHQFVTLCAQLSN